MAASKSFYMRNLPKSLTSFSSQEGREHFRRALLQGNLEAYFDLAAQYVTQARPEDCARSTLVMVLNALNLDPGKVWMKPWRWYSEGVLSCLDPKPGMSLHEFARTAMCNGTWVQAYHPMEEKERNQGQTVVSGCDKHEHSSRVKFASEATFRVALKSSVRRSGLIFVVNHSRPALGQTGEGHYSPIAGLDESTDKALVMDVARFKYPPFWVPVAKLYESLQWLDPEISRMRGFMLLSRTSDYSSTCRMGIDTTSLARIKDVEQAELMAKAPDDLLPLLYYCYYALSDVFDSKESEGIVREMEKLQAFGMVEREEIHPKIRTLVREIAENYGNHYLAMVKTALEGDNEGINTTLRGHIERIRMEIGVRSKPLA
jgi:glutathione gamma-glutamylcysteinyltransferase